MPRPPVHFIISRNNYHRCVVLQIIYSYFIFSQFSHQHCSFVRYNINKIILISPIWPHSIRHLAFYGLDPSAETRVPKKTKIFKNEYAKNTLPEGKFFCPLVSALQFWRLDLDPHFYVVSTYCPDFIVPDNTKLGEVCAVLRLMFYWLVLRFPLFIIPWF